MGYSIEMNGPDGSTTRDSQHVEVPVQGVLIIHNFNKHSKWFINGVMLGFPLGVGKWGIGNAPPTEIPSSLRAWVDGMKVSP